MDRPAANVEGLHPSSATRGPAVPRLALSPREAAAALGVSVDFLDEHISHELRWLRRGRKRFVAVAEIERWLTKASALAVGEDRASSRRESKPSAWRTGSRPEDKRCP